MENQITTQIAVKTKKRKIIDEADKKIMQEISNFDTELKKVMNDSQCEDTLYCQSLVPILKTLPLKKKRIAKIKISQLLYEFDEKCE